MSRLSATLFLVSLSLLFLPEFALANKFTTIGGGVSGANREKLEILKQIGSFTGVFLIVLGVLGILTKHRFEGFVGMRRKGERASPVPYVLIVLGALLSLLFFI